MSISAFPIFLVFFFNFYYCFGQSENSNDYYFSATIKMKNSRGQDTSYVYPKVWVEKDRNLALGNSIHIQADSMPVWFRTGEKKRAKPTNRFWHTKDGSYTNSSYKDTLWYSTEINFIKETFLSCLLTYPLHYDQAEEAMNDEWIEKLTNNKNGSILEYSRSNEYETEKIIYQLSAENLPIKQIEMYESSDYKEYLEIKYHQIHFNKQEIRSAIHETKPDFPVKLYQKSKKPVKQLKTKEQFQNLQIETLDGDSVNVLSNKKLQLIDFWFLACPPCMKSIPTTIKLLERLNIDKQIEFTTINGMDYEHKNAVKNWSKSVGLIPSQILFINRETLRGKYGIIGFPTLILLKEGQIVEIFDGWDNDQDELLEERILHHLKN
jgi:thiol-disulfide isomerase/thioredoxin